MDRWDKYKIGPNKWYCLRCGKEQEKEGITIQLSNLHGDIIRVCQDCYNQVLDKKTAQ